jgi:hypothetical protein
MWDQTILYSDRALKDERQDNNCENEKYDRGEFLKVKIHISFHGEN